MSHGHTPCLSSDMAGAVGGAAAATHDAIKGHLEAAVATASAVAIGTTATPQQ